MKFCVLALFDSKVKAFSQPFFSPSEEAGIRSVVDEAGRGDSMLQRHPEDFQVCRLGVFDDQDGLLVSERSPVGLGLVSSLMGKE
jgi:hypothetical protein